MPNIPETLHHYTTAAGLLGIFEPRAFSGWPNVPTTRSLTLWASDARYLNDSEELVYAAEALADAMLGSVDRNDAVHSARIKELSNRVRQGNFIDPNVDNSLHTAYVTSFCSKPDLLSQWRGYGANGYSIEFPMDLLKAFMVPAIRAGDKSVGFIGGSRLFPVRYGIDKEIIKTAAYEIAQRENYAGAVRKVVECLAQFKNPAFEAEDEWRLIWSSGHDYTACDYRISSSGMIIPYLQLRYTPFNMYNPSPDYRYNGKLVNSVLVGPSPDQGLRSESVFKMLRQRSFHDVSVEMSQTRFRG